MSRLGPAIVRSFKAENQSAAAASLAQEYMIAALQLTQQQIEGGDGDTHKGYLQQALLLALQQMYALQQAAEGQKEAKGGHDFM